MRKRLMREGWFFDCNCERCISETELGSHMSSLVCSICMQENSPGRKIPEKHNFDVFKKIDHISELII